MDYHGDARQRIASPSKEFYGIRSKQGRARPCYAKQSIFGNKLSALIVVKPCKAKQSIFGNELSRRRVARPGAARRDTAKLCKAKNFSGTGYPRRAQQNNAPRCTAKDFSAATKPKHRKD